MILFLNKILIKLEIIIARIDESIDKNNKKIEELTKK